MNFTEAAEKLDGDVDARGNFALITDYVKCCGVNLVYLLQSLFRDFLYAVIGLKFDRDGGPQQSIQAEGVGASLYPNIKDLTLVNCSLQKDDEIVYIMDRFKGLDYLLVMGGMSQTNWPTMDISRDILKSFLEIWSIYSKV